MTLRNIVDTPWYVTNHEIHQDLQVPWVKEEITAISNRYVKKLHDPTNPLAMALLDKSEEVRRLLDKSEEKIMAKTGGGTQSFSLRRIILQRSRSRSQNQSNNRLHELESGNSNHVNLEKPKPKIHTRPVKDVASCNEQSTSEYAIELPGDDELDQNDFDFHCIICLLKESEKNTFFSLELCGHRFCKSCLMKYLKNEINESRTDIACPQCSSAIHPNNIGLLLLDFPEFKYKYEDFMIRRYLVADPDSRWCPAPDCSYAVIASGCASCPQIQCERPSCRISFCYHCKAEWHPDQTCDAARASRQNVVRTSSVTFSQDSTRRDEIKPCPRCQVLIVKMNDGSCNHMICAVCGAEFCWLCMKEVSDLHYLSPSGCTFWGKKPWSRKKKIVWQIGTLIGAPVGIALLAGIAVPSMVIGIPVWVGRKLLDRYKTKTRQQRNICVTIGVTASILISPILAGLAIAIGVPILLFYVYGIVPVSLCRAGCGSSSSPTEEYKFEINVGDENRTQNSDGASFEAISRLGEPSIGDVSFSAASGSLMEIVNTNTNRNHPQSNRESTIALAGSVKNQKNEYTDDTSTESKSGTSDKLSKNTDTTSTLALAGSISTPI